MCCVYSMMPSICVGESRLGSKRWQALARIVRGDDVSGLEEAESVAITRCGDAKAKLANKKLRWRFATEFCSLAAASAPPRRVRVRACRRPPRLRPAAVRWVAVARAGAVQALRRPGPLAMVSVARQRIDDVGSAPLQLCNMKVQKLLRGMVCNRSRNSTWAPRTSDLSAASPSTLCVAACSLHPSTVPSPRAASSTWSAARLPRSTNLRASSRSAQHRSTR